MSNPKILIVIKEGAIMDVYVNHARLEVYVSDYDNPSFEPVGGILASNIDKTIRDERKDFEKKHAQLVPMAELKEGDRFRFQRDKWDVTRTAEVISQGHISCPVIEPYNTGIIQNQIYPIIKKKKVIRIFNQ